MEDGMDSMEDGTEDGMDVSVAQALAPLANNLSPRPAQVSKAPGKTIKVCDRFRGN